MLTHFAHRWQAFGCPRVGWSPKKTLTHFVTSGGMYSGSDLSLKSPICCSASRMACKSAGDSKESSGRVALKAVSSASLLFRASRLHSINNGFSVSVSLLFTCWSAGAESGIAKIIKADNCHLKMQ